MSDRAEHDQHFSELLVLRERYDRLRKAAEEFLENSCYTGHEDYAQALRAALQEEGK